MRQPLVPDRPGSSRSARVTFREAFIRTYLRERPFGRRKENGKSSWRRMKSHHPTEGANKFVTGNANTSRSLDLMNFGRCVRIVRRDGLQGIQQSVGLLVAV